MINIYRWQSNREHYTELKLPFCSHRVIYTGSRLQYWQKLAQPNLFNIDVNQKWGFFLTKKIASCSQVLVVTKMLPLLFTKYSRCTNNNIIYWKKIQNANIYETVSCNSSLYWATDCETENCLTPTLPSSNSDLLANVHWMKLVLDVILNEE